MLRYFWTATQKDRIRDTCTEYNLPSKVRGANYFYSRIVGQLLWSRKKYER